MLERIVVSMVLVCTGIAAYQLLLFAQRRRVMIGSRFEAATDRAVLLVFTSPTCAPCKLQQMPIIDRMLANWRDRIDVKVIDVSERPGVASQYGVWSVPTTIVLDRQRNIIAINQGIASERKLREQFEKTLDCAGLSGMLGTRDAKQWQPN